jgi:hypothetical protein
MQTALILPVPQVETPAVRAVRERHDPAAAAGVGAHITLFVPFLPLLDIDVDELGAVVRAFEPMRLSFSEVRTFPDVLWLHPEPPGPVVDLVMALAVHYPAAQRYGEEVTAGGLVPHLTLAMRDDAATRAEVDRAVNGLLPVEAVLDEVWLIARDAGGRWRRCEAFPLGPAA